MPNVFPGAPFPTFFSDSASVDAFSRLRSSEPFALFANTLVFDNAPLSFDDQQRSGTATSTYNSNQSSVTLGVTGNVAGNRTRQSFRKLAYQAGKSQLILCTGIIAATGAPVGVTRRIGQFDDNNGFYFQYGSVASPSSINVGIRTSTSGSPVDTIVPSGSWNIDKFNGSGPSGLTLDPTQVQIFVIDYQWLGTGRIRYGFDINGVIYYCHQTLIANSKTLVSISTPVNPIRYEIISAGTGAATAATMVQICCSVISEGGSESVGYPFSVTTGTTQLAAGNNTNIFPLLAIQFQSGKNNAHIDLSSFTVGAVTANSAYFTHILLNPTIVGTALSYNPITNSVLQFAIGTNATTITAGTGTQIYSEYCLNNKTGASGAPLPSEHSLGSSIAGVSDTLVLAVQAVPSLGITYSGTLSWRESY